jgi:hypothetical protein
MTVKCCGHTNKNHIFGTIYRRPGSNITHFNNLLSEKLQIISLENKPIIHMGDYNIDLLKSDSHSPTNDFLDLNMHHTLLPVITRPTRVTNSTATIIDNIFSNYLDLSKLTTCILPIDISDHFPICYFAKTDNQLHIPPRPTKQKETCVVETSINSMI